MKCTQVKWPIGSDIKMGSKIFVKIIGFGDMFCFLTSDPRSFIYFVLMILTVKYCLGKAINATDHGYQDIKSESKSPNEPNFDNLNESKDAERGNHEDYVGGSLDTDNIRMHFNVIETKNIPANASKNTGWTTEDPRSELPLPILIASPVAALSIVLLICIAYKWHSIQLDEQAKKFAIERAADQSDAPASPCRATQRLVPPGHARAECDLNAGGKRKSLLTPTPPPSISRSRASLWSADQEVLTHVHASPRRHSTFIL